MKVLCYASVNAWHKNDMPLLYTQIQKNEITFLQVKLDA